MTSRLAVPVLALAVLPLLGGSQGKRAGEPKDSPAERAKVVRATYQQVPPTILQIQEPIRVAQFTEQKLPKVIVLSCVDAAGTTHDFSWWLDKGKSSNREYDRIYWLHYEGIAGARKGPFRMAVRGPEEDAFYGLLLRWAATQEKKKDTLGLFDKDMLKGVNTLLDKLDARFGGEKPALQK